MKRRDVLKKPEAAGLVTKEGANHTLVYRGRRRVSLVARHREIPEGVAREIERQTGVKLR